jgi:hypothetical protein
LSKVEGGARSEGKGAGVSTDASAEAALGRENREAH